MRPKLGISRPLVRVIGKRYGGLLRTALGDQVVEERFTGRMAVLDGLAVNQSREDRVMFFTERERFRDDLVQLVDRMGRDRSALLPILEEVQRKYFHISEFCMQVIADLLDLHPVEVHSVVSFYGFLDECPQGQFVIRLCRTVTCDMAGKDLVARQLRNDLQIDFGQTTPDGKFTLAWANCLGMCDQGPALLVNDRVFTKVTPERVFGILSECRQMFGVHATSAPKEHGP